MEEYGRVYTRAVAAELRAERGAKQLTVAEVADRSGIPEVSLQRYLSGKRDLATSKFAAIALALEVDPGEILDRATKRVEREQP